MLSALVMNKINYFVTKLTTLLKSDKPILIQTTPLPVCLNNEIIFVYDLPKEWFDNSPLLQRLELDGSIEISRIDYYSLMLFKLLAVIDPSQREGFIPDIDSTITSQLYTTYLKYEIPIVRTNEHFPYLLFNVNLLPIA